VTLLLLLARLMSQYCFARWRLSLTSVRVCNTLRPACRWVHVRRSGDDIMPSQSNYSFMMVTLHGGPVRLRPVWATPCLILSDHCLCTVKFSDISQQHFQYTMVFQKKLSDHGAYGSKGQSLVRKPSQQF